MTIAKGQYEGPRVALTFDACTGKVDDRILSALIENHGAKHLAAIDVPMRIIRLDEMEAVMHSAILKMKNVDSWTELRVNCRAKIVEHYGLDAIVEHYRQIWAN